MPKLFLFVPKVKCIKALYLAHCIKVLCSIVLAQSKTVLALETPLIKERRDILVALYSRLNLDI